MIAAANDQFFMQKCLDLAILGQGMTKPNPMVAAVIVKNGQIIGQGYHQCDGEDHAEVNAFNSCTQETEGATLYCNLEPCCHTNKRTPPCLKLIIQKKIARVVIAQKDPNPQVCGKSLKLLEESGIKVSDGVLENEARTLNRIYNFFQQNKKPYIHLKYAQTLNGKISPANKTQKWISSSESVNYVHQLRTQYHGILIGGNTALTDNPQLTVRYHQLKDDPKFKQPTRFIVSRQWNKSFEQLQLFNYPNQQTVFVSPTKPPPLYRHLEIPKLDFEKKEDLESFLLQLGKSECQSLLVEAGPEILKYFIKHQMFQEISIIISPHWWDEGQSLDLNQNLDNFIDQTWIKSGHDIILKGCKNLCSLE